MCTRVWQRPLLIDGCKFDIRVYVLVCGWDEPSRIWLYDVMLLKLCRQPFDLERLYEPLRHLTNCAVQSAGGRQSKHATIPGVDESSDTLWSSNRFSEWLRDQGYGETAWEQQVLPAIGIVAKATLNRAYAQHAPAAAPRRRSFEVFGLDVILDAELRPWLLEVNESPNLRDHGVDVLEPLLDSLLYVISAGASVGSTQRPLSSLRGALSGTWQPI